MLQHVFGASVTRLLTALGVTLPGTSRAFLPAFLAAAYLRVVSMLMPGTQFELLYEAARSASPWFTSDLAIAVLFGLTAIEFYMVRHPDLAGLLLQTDPFTKPMMAFVTTFGVIGGGATGTAAEGLVQGNVALALDIGAASMSAGLVFVSSVVRGDLLELVEELDLSAVRKVIAWFEEFFVMFAVVLLVALPFVLLGLTILVFVTLAILEKYMDERAKKLRRPCAACAAPTWPHGLHCAGCGAPNPDVRDVGFLGGSLERRAQAPLAHQLRLVRVGRCPRCATALKRRTGAQNCDACGSRLFGNDEAILAYAALTSGWVEWRVVLLCGLFGFVPLLGAIAALVTYNLVLVRPYRRYLPRTTTMGLRFLTRAISLVLFFLSLIPGISILTTALLPWVNHRLYRYAFVRAARAGGRALDTVAAPTPGWFTRLGLGRLHGWGDRARPAFAVGFALAAVFIAVGVWLGPSASADAPPQCIDERGWIVGAWSETMTPFHLLNETFESGGLYFVEGMPGRYTFLRPGALRFQLGAATEDYRMWASPGGLYYLHLSGRWSSYERLSPPPAQVVGCSTYGASLAGRWADEGTHRLVLAADGTARLDDLPGAWSDHGSGIRVGGILGRYDVALSRADELMLYSEDERFVMHRISE